MKRTIPQGLAIALCGVFCLPTNATYAVQTTAKITEVHAKNATAVELKKVDDTAGNTIQVKDVDQLVAAIAQAKGQQGPMEIVLADGEYKTDHTLLLVAANNVRISAAKNASIHCTKPDAKTMIVAYCDNVQLENITLKCTSSDSNHGSLENLFALDHATNVRLTQCTLEVATNANANAGDDSNSGNQAMQTSDAVKEFLGKEILDIVSAPDKILSFRLNPRDDDGPKMLGPHEITAEGPALTAEQSKILISVILDEKTYDFTSAKRSFLVPTFGFKFIKGDQEVALLVDAQYRNEVMFVFKGEEKKEDCDSAKGVLQELTKSLFPEAK